MKENILDSFPSTIKKEILNLYFIAKDRGYFSYLIGGIVRDWILKKPTKDIDMVIEGNAIEIAKIYSEKYHTSVRYFPSFQTARIPLNNKFFANIDLISTRKEIYEFSGALPKVSSGNLQNDLYRRDFTINTLCYSLDTSEIIDLFHGEEDIKNKLIRILYSESFIDDPTRILRAIRFKNRFDFQYEKLTRRYMIEAINKRVFNTISRDRIKKELMLCLQEKKSKEILLDFIKLNILDSLLFIDDISREQMNWLQKIDTIIEGEDKILITFLIIFFYANEELIKKFCDFYEINKTYKELLMSNGKTFLKIEDTLKKHNLTPFEIYKLLSPLKREQMIFLSAYLQRELFMKRILEYYNNELRDIHILITGKDLISLGIPPGPIYHTIFEEVLKNKINFGWKTKKQEIEYIKKNIKGWRK